MLRSLFLATLCAGRLLAQSPEAALTYLGNMGVLLERGETRIVIDGLHRGELAEYAAVPPALLSPLERAEAPFAHLTAALTTHRHRDHFDARSVMARLTADPAMLYAAARETVDTLTSRAGALPGGNRLRALGPEGREWSVAPGITAFDLPHNPTPSARVANIGFLVDLGGLRVLHVGDADPALGTFASHAFAGRVDVAIVPFWYLLGADDSIRRRIGARIWVATHIPPGDSASVRRRVTATVPGALVLTAPGERHQLR